MTSSQPEEEISAVTEMRERHAKLCRQAESARSVAHQLEANAARENAYADRCEALAADYLRCIEALAT